MKYFMGYDEVCKIKLTNGMFCFVDADEFEELSKYKWSALYNKYTKSHYATTMKFNELGKRCICYMHRLLMNPNKDLQVDHINHNTLDNRKHNLRVVSVSQNQMNQKIRSDNTSGVKGVSWCNKRKKWCSSISINKKAINLGRFKLKCLAVKARKDAEEKYFGEYKYKGE